MRKRTDFIVVKEFNSREDLLKFLNELDKKYNLNQIIISIAKDTFGRYEVFYKDYSLEKPEDRLL
jgi:hypothetical protein